MSLFLRYKASWSSRSGCTFYTHSKFSVYDLFIKHQVEVTIKSIQKRSCQLCIESNEGRIFLYALKFCCPLKYLLASATERRGRKIHFSVKPMLHVWYRMEMNMRIFWTQGLKIEVHLLL